MFDELVYIYIIHSTYLASLSCLFRIDLHIQNGRYRIDLKLNL
jgi:hypothetical protein